MTPSERFWSKVAKDEPDACWIWRGKLRNDGYGEFSAGRRKKFKAHRWSLEERLGRPLIGIVMHSCDVKLCVNPSHLREGTNKENSRDMVAKGRAVRMIENLPKQRPGEKNTNARLTAAQVIEIRSSESTSDKDLAARFGVSRSNIYMVRSGRTWTSIRDGKPAPK
jgi:hypothetical protein